MIKRNTKIRNAVRGTNVIQNNLPLNENEWKYALENHIKTGRCNCSILDPARKG